MFNNYLNVYYIDEYKNVKENLTNIVEYSVKNYFQDKPLFEDKMIKYYFYDDYLLDTNVSKNNYLTIYVEINQPKNIKDIQSKKFLKKDKHIKDLHLTLEEIKNGIFEQLVANFDENTLLWQEKYSINLSINEIVDDKKINYLVKIIPCFSYKNENNVNGVVYYDNNLYDVEIEYPLLSIKNFKEKNKNTNNLLTYYDVLIKNILQTERKEEFTYFEIFETLLYNVPDSLFIDKSDKTLIQIINFLRNYNFREYKTIDDQDFMFTSKYKSFSVLYVKHALGQIEKHINKLIKK